MVTISSGILLCRSLSSRIHALSLLNYLVTLSASPHSLMLSAIYVIAFFNSCTRFYSAVISFGISLEARCSLKKLVIFL